MLKDSEVEDIFTEENGNPDNFSILDHLTDVFLVPVSKLAEERDQPEMKEIMKMAKGLDCLRMEG